MNKPALHQAVGLNALAHAGGLRVMTIASATAGAGKTSAAANLAAALGQAGRDVLVLDGSRFGAIGAAFGVHARHDLADVIEGGCTLDQALVDAAPGVRVLAIARALRPLARLDARGQARIVDLFASLASPVDAVLVDTASESIDAMLPAGLAAQEILIVVSRTSASITANYALMKALRTGYGVRRFRVLVNKAASETEARMVYDNLAAAAADYLAVRLEYAGHVPRDDKLARAAVLSTPLVDAFPAAPAAAAYRRLAAALLASEPARIGEHLEHFVRRLVTSSRAQAGGA